MEKGKEGILSPYSNTGYVILSERSESKDGIFLVRRFFLRCV